MSGLKIALITTEERETHSRYDLPDPWFGVAPTSLLDGLKQCPELEVHVITCVRSPVKMPERLAPNMFCRIVQVPRWGFLRTAYLPCILKIRRILKALRPHIVHGQGTERFAALAAVFSGYPNVVTLHGIMSDIARVAHARPGSFYWLTARLESLALRRTLGVFCNSRCTQAAVAPRTSRTWLVPNSVREVFLTPPHAIEHPTRCLLLNVGVICENKQQLELLRTARFLWEQKLDFELHFIGAVDGNSAYGRAFLDHVRQAERDGYARYLGPKTAEELVTCFDRASALVHTPIVESFGLVVAEALARNLKFFGFRVGGVPDVVEGGVGIVLVEPNDWAGLANAIAGWLRTGRPAPPQTSNLMRQRYHPLVIARRHREIYGEVLHRHP